MSRAALRTSPAATPAPVAPPTTDPGRSDQLPWLGPIGLIVVSALVLVVSDGYIRSQLSWLEPMFKDLRRWLRDPTIAGGWSAPARPLAGLAVLVIAGAIGVAGARLLVRGTRLSGERFLVAGLGVTLGVCVLGYVGMLGVAFGVLSAPWLAGLLALIAVAVGMVTVSRRRSSAGDEVIDLSGMDGEAAGESRRPRALLAVTALLAVMVVGLMTLHASLAPVQEWDAIVYHAASAKNWFEERPSPPIVYGPSVGVEISGNYPPLFPAAGAAVYTLIGRFDDLYLRILPPLLFAAILLMTFGYARRRFGHRSACFAVLLLLGTPLLVMYGVWPTGYILLAAALLATVILLDLAVSSGSRWHWAAAGLVGGLAVLSHVYGFMAIAVAICAVLVARRRRIGNLAAFLLVAGVVAAPWLLRNLVLLHDPFYPLGSPPFHGIGLVQPIWDASKAEVKNAALGFWQVPSGSSLRLTEVATALFDRNLLPLGLYFGLVLGLAQFRRNRTMALVALSLVAVLAAVIAPGWYWLRGLVPALPLAALLTGRGLDLLVRSGRRVRARGGRLPSFVVRSATVVAVSVPLVAGGVTGLAIAGVGPNGHTWVTSMTGQDDFAASLRSLGDARQTLWNVFSGDTLLWAWMNALPAGQRVATLEVRTYYLNRPQDLFYLDGLEAAPLMTLRNPEAIERFLRSKGVRYVMLPQWAADGRTSHPVTRILPMFRVLGTDRFPLVGTFALDGSEMPSRVFSVGPSTLPLSTGVFPGADLPAPAAVDPTFTIPAGGLDARIFAPVPLGEPSALAFDYDRHGVGKFSINAFHLGDDQWELDYLKGRGGGTGWASALVPLSSPGSFADLGMFVRQGSLRIRNVRVVPLLAPTVLLDADAGDSVATKGAPVVLGVPVTGGHAAVSFSWRGAGRLSLLARSTAGTWSRIQATAGPPTGAPGGWRTATFTIRAALARAVLVRVVADGGDVTVRNVGFGTPNTSNGRSHA